MDIGFFRGDDHKVRFKFKNFNGVIDKMFFTVKDANRRPRIQKRLDDGISFDNGYYCIAISPSDTDDLPCSSNMIYDIEIITGGEKKTVAKGNFSLKEDVTTPDCEV